MAERIVLAELVVDDSGVVTSIKDSTEKIRLFEKHSKDAADTIASRLFNMRSAAVAFLGAFTFAGAIYELKSLVGAVFQASDAWEKYSESSKKAGQTTANLLADITGITDTLETTAGWMERMNALSAAGKAAGYEGPTVMGIIGNWLFGGQLPAITNGLNAIGGWLDKRLGTGAYAKPEPLIDPAAVAAWEAAVKAGDLSGEYLSTSQPLSASSQYTKAASLGGMLVPKALRVGEDLTDVLRDADPLIDQVTGRLLDFNAASENTGIIWGENHNIIEQNLEKMQSFDEVFDADKFSAIAGALQGVGLALSEMISTGANARELFSGMLRSLSAAMFVKAAEYVAYAIAAQTGIGGVTLKGTPSQFLRAAAKFAAVGVAAGIGARSTGGAGASQGGYAQTVPQAVGAPPAPQVTIILQGELSNVSLRKITGGVLKSIGDGVGAGQFVFSGA